jgi:hypothetical protein
MKYLIFFIILLFVSFACKQADPEPKLISNTAQITFETVPDGGWIQLDDNEKFYHYLDTNKFVDQPDGIAIVQRNYPRDLPKISDFSTGWISDRYFVGLVSGKWFPSYSSGGLSAYSFFRNLVEDKRIANPYNTLPKNDKMQYSIRFDNFDRYRSDSLQYYYQFPNGQGFSDKKAADKYAKITIERLDGKDIKITTSEGYKIKVVYW